MPIQILSSYQPTLKVTYRFPVPVWVFYWSVSPHMPTHCTHTPTASSFQLISEPWDATMKCCGAIVLNPTGLSGNIQVFLPELQSQHSQKSPAINSALAHLFGVTQPSITVTLPAASRFHLLTAFHVLPCDWECVGSPVPVPCPAWRSLLCAACQKNLQMGKCCIKVTQGKDRAEVGRFSVVFSPERKQEKPYTIHSYMTSAGCM